MSGGEFSFGCALLAFGLGLGLAALGDGIKEGLSSLGSSLGDGLSNCWLAVEIVEPGEDEK